MLRSDRKTLIDDYKKRTMVAGIYAVHCAATGETWIGQAPNIDAIHNSTWFALRNGGHIHRELQAAWNQHGEAAFSLEILERLAEDVPAYGRASLLRDRLKHWRAVRGGGVL